MNGFRCFACKERRTVACDWKVQGMTARVCRACFSRLASDMKYAARTRWRLIESNEVGAWNHAADLLEIPRPTVRSVMLQVFDDAFVDPLPPNCSAAEKETRVDDAVIKAARRLNVSPVALWLALAPPAVEASIK